MEDGEFCLLDLGNQKAVCLKALWIWQERVATRVPDILCDDVGLRIGQQDPKQPRISSRRTRWA